MVAMRSPWVYFLGSVSRAVRAFGERMMLKSAIASAAKRGAASR